MRYSLPSEDHTIRMTARPATRLYVAESLAQSRVTLAAAHAHFLRNVLRLESGARIALFNARDGEYAARIETLTKAACVAAPEDRIRAPVPEPDLWLVFAPIKRARLDFLVEKATELGVSALLPVITGRTNVERVNLERWRANAIEAAEQSERLSVPDIAAPVAFAKLVAEWPAARRLILCDETGFGPPMAEALRALSLDGPHAVMIGPEGGFAPAELDALRNLPSVTPVGLGPRVLRADTAALAALAVFQALHHERFGAPPPRFRGQE
jgi:16S rRNA (uracil1498-N3)-methyltransferase